MSGRVLNGPRPSRAETLRSEGALGAVNDVGWPGVTSSMMSEARGRRIKRRTSRMVERRLVNPLNRWLVESGRIRDTYAILETIGRRTGLPRQVPVANGLVGDVFWLISAHGEHAHYVQNLLAEPRVRVGLRQSEALVWRSGTARIVPGDDTRARQRSLGRGRIGYRIDAIVLRATATSLTTIRIDLDPAPQGVVTPEHRG